jgi:hypothetical protein
VAGLGFGGSGELAAGRGEPDAGMGAEAGMAASAVGAGWGMVVPAEEWGAAGLAKEHLGVEGVGNAAVFGATDKLKVAEGVVELVAVDVVDVLGVCQVAAKVDHHDEAMGEDAAAADTEHPVAVVSDAAVAVMMAGRLGAWVEGAWGRCRWLF